MKTLLAFLVCLGQTFIVLAIIAGVRNGVSATNTNLFLNLILLVAAVADITYVNYLVWKAVTKSQA